MSNSGYKFTITTYLLYIIALIYIYNLQTAALPSYKSAHTLHILSPDIKHSSSPPSPFCDMKQGNKNQLQE